MANRQTSVLFVCTGNAGRSQIAEALMRQRKADVQIASAGVDHWEALHPMAVDVMQARGLSMAGQYPKPPEVFAQDVFDVVVTIGDPARALLPRALRDRACWVHWDLADPADADGTDRSRATFEHTLAYVQQRLPEIEQLLARRAAAAPRALLKPGISTGLWPRNFEPATHLPQIKAAGFEAIELNLFFGPDHLDDQDEQAVKSLAAIAADLGLDIWSIHSPDVASLAAINAVQRQKQIDALRHCLDLADVLGSHSVVSHGLLKGDPESADKAAEADRLLASAQSLVEHTEGGSARIAYENGYGSARSAREIMEVLDQLPESAAGFCFDTGHANIAGDDDVIMSRAPTRLLTLHLNDNDSQRDNHRQPGDGCVDWTATRDWLERIGYTGCVMYELLALDEDPGVVLRRAGQWHAAWWSS